MVLGGGDNNSKTANVQRVGLLEPTPGFGALVCFRGFAVTFFGQIDRSAGTYVGYSQPALFILVS